MNAFFKEDGREWRYVIVSRDGTRVYTSRWFMCEASMKTELSLRYPGAIWRYG